MKISSNKLVLILFLIFITIFNALKVKKEMMPFDSEKEKIEGKINSMKLGNYLRKLMLKNNDLLDNDFIFLEHEDFNLIHNDDLNYSNMQMEDDDNEFRARLFSYKFVKANQSHMKKGLKPYSISEGTEQVGPHWKNYHVLMMGPKGENKLLKVCLPLGLEENFALVMNFKKECAPKIQKIKEYKILDEEGGNEESQLLLSKTSLGSKSQITEQRFKQKENLLDSDKKERLTKKQQEKEKKSKYEKSIIL
jgi:hypothetical protein